jgi:hypothetical protein
MRIMMHLRNDEEKLNRLNQRLLEAVPLGGDAFLSSTTILGAFAERTGRFFPRDTPAARHSSRKTRSPNRATSAWITPVLNS